MDFKTKYALLGIGLCFAIPIVGIIISLLLRPFYHPRYILPVLGVFWLGISILLSKNFDKKYIFIPIIVIILISSVVGAMTFYDNLEYRQEVDTNNNNIPSKLNNYSVVEVPIDIIDSKLFNYTDLKIYKIDLNNN